MFFHQMDEILQNRELLEELSSSSAANVSGKVKTLLADEKISVNIDSLLEIVQDKKGVQVDLCFNNDKFSFFLTR